MFLLEWQAIAQKHLADFSVEELLHLQDLSAVPSDRSTVHTLCLSQEDTYHIMSFYEQENPYVPGKLPQALSALCIQSELITGKSLYYFQRLQAHPDWYVLDLFQEGRYLCTFLALDSEPIPDLFLLTHYRATYIPVCILTNLRDKASTSQAYQAFKFAHYLFCHQTATVL